MNGVFYAVLAECYKQDKLVLDWQDLYVMHKEEFSITFCMCHTYTWQRRSLLIRHERILSSDRMLHKDCDRKGSVAKKKISGYEPQRAWRQDELIGSKLPVVK
jgi:hypothetical protein